MLPRRLSSTKPISVDEFSAFLRALFPGGRLPPRLGLAVSGGVDSMALAHLLHLLQEHHHQLQPTTTTTPPPAITAYIIDHLSRPTSTAEAHSVSAYLRTQYNFPSEILTVQWPTPPTTPSAATKFELLARIHRYHLLCHASLRNSTPHLLLAHHLNDQAETVLMRLISRSGPAGLSGIKPVAQIPECHSIRGAEKVRLYRPLLGVGKERLVETCVTAGVRWWEDGTNADRTLTRRNAVRWLLAGGGGGQKGFTLPRALQREGLVAFAERMRRRVEAEEEAIRPWVERVSVTIDTVSGQAIVVLPLGLGDCGREGAGLAVARVLSRIAEMVAPCGKVDGQVIRDVVMPRVFSGVGEVAAFTAAGLRWAPVDVAEWRMKGGGEGEGDDILVWRLTRQTPVASQPVPEVTLNWDNTTTGPTTATSSSSTPEWHIFDNRFFLRRIPSPTFSSTPPPPPITIRLSPPALPHLRTLLSTPHQPHQPPSTNLQLSLKRLPPEARIGIPIAFIGEKPVGLPSLGLWVPGTLAEGEKVECIFRGEKCGGETEEAEVGEGVGGVGETWGRGLRVVFTTK